MKRKLMTAAVAAAAVLSMSMVSYAGTWQNADGGWKYQNDDGSYVQNTWQWIDGDGNGVAESYYFDGNGNLLTDTTTPDGYTVNQDGAWVKDGVLQQQTASQPAGAASTVDAAAIYAEASKKAAALNSMEMDMKMNMNMSANGESMDAVVDMNVKYKDLDTSALKFIATMNINMLGEQMGGTIFYTDGYYYMDMDGQKMKIAMNLDRIMEQTKQISGMTNMDMSYMRDIQMTTDESGNYVITYTMDGAALMSQLDSIYGAMGINMGSQPLNLSGISGRAVIGADGYSKSEQISMVMDMSVEGQGIRTAVNVDITYKNPGQPVNFALPSTAGYTDMMSMMTN